MTRPHSIWLLGALLAAGAAGQAQTGLPATMKEPSFLAYAFDDQAKLFKAAVDKGDPRAALMVYNDLAEVLAKKAPRFDAWYYKVAAAFNQDLEKRVQPLAAALAESTAAPEFPESRWMQAGAAYRDLRAALDDDRTFKLLEDPRFRDRSMDAWEKLAASADSYFSGHRVDGFKEFLAGRSGEDFFQSYPLLDHVAEAPFLEALMPQIQEHARANPEIGRDRIYPWLCARLSTQATADYLEAALHPGAARSWPEFAQAVKAMKAANTPEPVIRLIFDKHVTVLAIAGPESLDHHLKLPELTVREVPAGQLEAALAAAREGQEFAVVLAGASSRIDRQVVQKTDLDSRFVSGQHFEPNMNYDTARNNAEIARQNFQQAQASYSQAMANNGNNAGNVWAAIGQGLSNAAVAYQLGAARRDLDQAMATLHATPRQVKVLDYQPYTYSTTDVTASKEVSYTVYFIGTGASGALKARRKHDLAGNFRIAYNLHPKDEAYASLRRAHHQESDVEAFEKEPCPVLLASLIDDDPAFERIDRARIAADLQSAQPGPASRPKSAAAKVAAETREPRFESVVVVMNPRGGLGAGFFVGPNLILTNQHVVAGTRFPEVKLHSGEVCLGKVMKSDLGLDLALIKVPRAGRTMELLEDDFEVGTSVDAIGHPKGLTYSLTRGIISAVRYIENPLVPGSRKMLVIQTDAAINTGNSGGPLLVGEKAVGINSQKLVEKGTEGLGFALHATEIKRFLEDVK